MATQLRFEIWASDTGEASHWKLLRGGIFEFEALAIERAKQLKDGYANICVERWDAGRNVYLTTVYEAP